MMLLLESGPFIKSWGFFCQFFFFIFDAVGSVMLGFGLVWFGLACFCCESVLGGVEVGWVSCRERVSRPASVYACHLSWSYRLCYSSFPGGYLGRALSLSNPRYLELRCPDLTLSHICNIILLSLLIANLSLIPQSRPRSLILIILQHKPPKLTPCRSDQLHRCIHGKPRESRQ